MNIDKIKDAMVSCPAFRMRQVYKAIFHDLADSWEEVSVLPKNLRESLGKEAPLAIDAEISEAKDGNSAKALIDLGDTKVETVLMRHKDGRNTVCVSTQAGCKMGCDFCLTGKMGFSRGLSYQEIVEQVLVFARYLKSKEIGVTNVVLMGMGEPFDNYDESMKAVRFLNDKETMNIGARRMSISTVGIVEGINKLASDPLQVNLAVSFHASNDHLRNKLMPISRAYPLKTLMRSIASYLQKTNRKVLIEYIMLKKVNDKDEQAHELAHLLKNGLSGPFAVNLISYNQTGKYQPSDASIIKKFKDILEGHGLEVVQRYKFGRDIKAACGQLAGSHNS